MRKLASDRRFVDRKTSQQLMHNMLEDLGFAGIWTATSFKSVSKEQERKCAALIDRLIEVCDMISN